MKLSPAAMNVLMVTMSLAALGSVTYRVLEHVRNAPPEIVSVRKDWKQFAAEGAKIGPSTAPVTMIVFSDFQCPYCKQFADSARAALRRYPEEVRLVFRHRPIKQLHAYATEAAKVAVCADHANRFTAMHDLLFERQQSLGTVPWMTFAVEAGISDTTAFALCLEDDETIAILERDLIASDLLEVTGTPVVLVNEVMVRGMPQRNMLDSLIREALAQ